MVSRHEKQNESVSKGKRKSVEVIDMFTVLIKLMISCLHKHQNLNVVYVKNMQFYCESMIPQ